MKVILVWEILHDRLWAYLGLIYLTIGFMIYQIYRISYSASVSLILLTVFDAAIVYLTIMEYRKRRHGSASPSGSGGEPSGQSPPTSGGLS